jgi:hypothetical protein
MLQLHCLLPIGIIVLQSIPVTVEQIANLRRERLGKGWVLKGFFVVVRVKSLECSYALPKVEYPDSVE